MISRPNHTPLEENKLGGSTFRVSDMGELSGAVEDFDEFTFHR